MKNPNQYKGNGTPTEGTVPVPKLAVTKTPADSKLQQLEEQLASQHQLILKLRRDISRLKSDVSDVIATLNNRG